MCGIGFLLASSPAEKLELDACLGVLRRRGPDADATTLVQLQDGGALHLMAAVLHLRGEHMCLQPSEDADGNILLWNGEVFGGLEVGPLESDTNKVLGMLSGTSSHQEVVSALAGISGPFSFVYWVPGRRALYYGRDAVGRRSLVIRRPRAPGEPLTVMSCLPEGAGVAEVGTETGHGEVVPEGGRRVGEGVDVECAGDETIWEEVHADGVYSLHLENLGGGGEGGDWNVPSPVRHAWPVSSGAGAATTRKPSIAEPSEVCHCCRQQPSSSTIGSKSRGGDVCNGQASAEQGITTVQVVPPAVFPSGGAFVAGRCGTEVAKFPSTVERVQIPASNSLGSVAMVDEESDEENDGKVKRRPKTEQEGASAVGPEGELCKASLGLLSQLRRSIRRRVRSIPYTGTPGSGETPDRRIESTVEGAQVMAGSGHFDGGSAPVSARVGVLFSGGLDSVVVAAMLAEGGGEGRGGPAVPEGEAIDLINVCFDSPSGHASPDRLASMAAVCELQALFPSHTWRLLCVDASYEDVLRHKKDIWRVMQPCSTTMDFNIAAAFWFASSGRGWLYQPPLPPAAAPPSPPPASLESLAQQPLRVEGSGDTNPTAGLKEEVSYSGGKVESFTTSSVEPHVNITGKAAMAGAGHGGKGATATILSEGGGGGLAPTVASVGNTVAEEQERGCCKGKTPPKVNKNNDELCPVEGCRRLLKPGCVFGSCSRCCLKAQGLLDTADSASPRTTSTDVEETQPGATAPTPRAAAVATFDRRIPCSLSSVTPSTDVDDIAKEELIEADAATANGSTVPGSVVIISREESAAMTVVVTAPGEGEGEGGGEVAASGHEKKNQLQCKTYAVSQALRALEDHLTNHFFDDLSSPSFCADELALLLRRDAPSRQVRVGRNIHLRSPAPNPGLAGCSGGGGGGVPREVRGGNGARKSMKWCPIHKKSRPRGEGGNRGARGGGGALRGDGLEIGAEEGSVGLSASATMFTSAARVLLVGIGADEFMAGYSRHRNAYNRGGAAALTDELLKDQGRLWTRNLGRDDRSIGDHGREARFPFLEEDVVGFIRSLPLRDVCNMEEPPGVGDKKILREVASYLGLDSCRSLPKRAIQFGSRIAQHSARHTHGSHRRGSGSDPAYAIRSGAV